MKELYVFPMNDYRSYLQHHGIMGQKHGVRNAPWYPIADWQAHLKNIGVKSKDVATYTAKAVAKAGASAGKAVKEASDNAIKEHKKKTIVKKAQKTRAANIKAKKEAEEAQKDFEQLKQDILRKGTPGEIVRFAPNLTDKEVQEAMLRQTNIDKLKQLEKTRLKDIAEAEHKRKWGKVENMIKVVGTFATGAGNLANAINKTKALFKALGLDDEDSSKNNTVSNKKDKSNKDKKDVKQIKEKIDTSSQSKTKKAYDHNGVEDFINSINNTSSQSKSSWTVEGTPKTGNQSGSSNIVDADFSVNVENAIIPASYTPRTEASRLLLEDNFQYPAKRS